MAGQANTHYEVLRSRIAAYADSYVPDVNTAPEFRLLMEELEELRFKEGRSIL